MVDQAGAELPPLLVFSDDWGRHPSSCQHLVSQLLDRTQVCWVNTIGMRPPSPNLATLRRASEKLCRWVQPLRSPRPEPVNPLVANPLMWPWSRSTFDRLINRALLRRQLGPLLQALPGPPVAVTTIPVVTDLIGELPVTRWVYYCVDDFTEWPGLDRIALRAMEERLVHQADVLLSASASLKDRIAGMGRSAYLLTHGVDLTHWRTSARDDRMPELDGLERPLIVFWGLIDQRMDVAFLERLSADLERGTILLVGPELQADPALRKVGRIAFRPALPFRRLPALAREAAVLVMPYTDSPVTRAMQPLKLKEYLASGKPVIVRDLPSTREWADCLDLASTADAFSRIVRERLTSGLPEGQRAAHSRLLSESWASKADCFARLLLTSVPPETGHGPRH